MNGAIRVERCPEIAIKKRMYEIGNLRGDQKVMEKAAKRKGEGKGKSPPLGNGGGRTIRIGSRTIKKDGLT